MRSPAVNNKRLLDLHAVAERLSVSRDSVDRLLRNGKLPFIRLPGGRRRVTPEDLERAIENWRVEGC